MNGPSGGRILECGVRTLTDGRSPSDKWAVPSPLASAPSGLPPSKASTEEGGAPRRAALRTRRRLHHRHMLGVRSAGDALGVPNRGPYEANTENRRRHLCHGS